MPSIKPPKLYFLRLRVRRIRNRSPKPTGIAIKANGRETRKNIIKASAKKDSKSTFRMKERISTELINAVANVLPKIRVFFFNPENTEAPAISKEDRIKQNRRSGNILYMMSI